MSKRTWGNVKHDIYSDHRAPKRPRAGNTRSSASAVPRNRRKPCYQKPSHPSDVSQRATEREARYKSAIATICYSSVLYFEHVVFLS